MRYFGFLNNTGSLAQRIRAGGLMVVGEYGAGQFLRLLSNLILTRLLMPEAFGLMAAAVSITVLAIMLTDIGINNCIIRSENSDDERFLWTAWTIKILRNLAIWALVIVGIGGVLIVNAAGLVPEGSTFSDPRLPLVMALTSLQLIISAFTSVKTSLATRDLLTGRMFVCSILSQLSGAIATIWGAYAGLGVWALPLGLNVSAIMSLITSFALFPGPPMRFCWDKKHVAEVIGFGKWLMLSSFFGFMTNKGDHMIFGWALAKAQFGLYAVSSIWIGVASHLIETIINRILYPGLNTVMRERPQNLARAYQRSRLVLDGLAVAIAFGIYFLSDFIFGILYPESFSGVAYYLKLMTPIVLFTPYRLLSFVVLAAGDSKRFTLVSFVTGVSTLVLTPVVISLWGPKAGVIAFACVNATSAPVLWHIVKEYMPIDWFSELRMLVVAIFFLFLLIGAPTPVG